MLVLTGVGVGATVPAGIEVRVERPDGASLKGTWTLAGNGKQPAVLLLHQAGSSRSEFDFLLPDLHARGWHTLAIDLRGHGESTKRFRAGRRRRPRS